jgi:hypothetical protein
MKVSKLFNATQAAVLDLIEAETDGRLSNMYDSWGTIAVDGREYDLQVGQDDDGIFNVTLFDLKTVNRKIEVDIDSYFPVFSGTEKEFREWLKM